MSDYNYVPLFCHTCGTIIEACANGYHIRYSHNKRESSIKGKNVKCSICQGEEISLADHLTDQEIMQIENDFIFAQAAKRFQRKHLLKLRNAET